jgi:Zn-dependent peptidase ImmA (M78 family)
MEKLKILGCDYDVTEVDQVARDEYKFGEVDHVEQTILISRNLKPQRKVETILHEVFHCLLFEMGEMELHGNEAFINIVNPRENL